MSNTLKSITDSLIHGGNNTQLYGLGLSPSSSILQDAEFLGDINDIASTAIGAIQGVTQVANMAYCTYKLFTTPNMLLGVLDNITNNLMAVALAMAERLASVLEAQIMGIFGTVAGTAINLVNSILGFLTNVIKIYENLMAIWDNLKNRGFGDWAGFIKEQDCEYMFASIAACLLNKLYGDKLAKFEQKVTSKIVETGQSINSALASELADVNTLGNYVRHESFMLEKANKQLELFR